MHRPLREFCFNSTSVNMRTFVAISLFKTPASNQYPLQHKRKELSSQAAPADGTPE